MAIKLGTYTPKQGGIGVFIQRLSGEHLDYFRPILNVTDEITECNITSERLKHTKTIEAAKNWIDKFRAMPIEEQIGRIGGKWIKVLPKEQDKIAVNVQHYKLMNSKGITITSSPFVNQLEQLGEAYGDYKVKPTVSKPIVMTRDYYDTVKDQIIETTAKAKSKRLTAMENWNKRKTL